LVGHLFGEEADAIHSTAILQGVGPEDNANPQGGRISGFARGVPALV
jgi:hypothetical protein